MPATGAVKVVLGVLDPRVPAGPLNWDHAQVLRAAPGAAWLCSEPRVKALPARGEAGTLMTTDGFCAPASIAAATAAAALSIPAPQLVMVQLHWPSLVVSGQVGKLLSPGKTRAVRLMRLATSAASALFVLLSMAAGGGVALAAGADRKERFTLAVEFATRNCALAAAVAVTLLGDTRFAVFATTYFFTEAAIVGAAIVFFRLLTATP